MSLTPPKRLFHIPSMSTVFYNVADNAGNKRYATISHVWGDQKMYSAEELGIKGGVNWLIPLSNPNKIRRLVDAMNRFGMEYCWFDVLCMPQDNQDEINLEIPFMGDYYGGARMTFVLSDIDYTISDDYAKWYIMVSDVMESERGFTWDERNWICEESNLLDFHKDKWFTRVWTLQEAVLSKNIILASANGHYINLFDVIGKLSYLSSINFVYDSKFRGSADALIGIGTAVQWCKNKDLDLTRVLSTNIGRECYKKEDRFYGIFGILGYKDFIVKYDMDIDDLNKLVARYAYSKGDISWMSVGGDTGTSFIQPMYKRFSQLGSCWKKDKSDANVSFDDALYINAANFATVTRCEKFVGDSGNFNKVVKWLVDVFRGWKFSSADIFDAIIGYSIKPEEFIRAATKFLDTIAECATFQDASRKVTRAMTEQEAIYLVDLVTILGVNTTIYTTLTLIEAKVNISNQVYPSIVSGNADIGDKIATPKMCDIVDRRIGIITSGFRRRGLCFIPRTKVCEREPEAYTPHKFLL